MNDRPIREPFLDITNAIRRRGGVPHVAAIADVAPFPHSLERGWAAEAAAAVERRRRLNG